MQPSQSRFDGQVEGFPGSQDQCRGWGRWKEVGQVVLVHVVESDQHPPAAQEVQVARRVGGCEVGFPDGVLDGVPGDSRERGLDRLAGDELH